MRITCIAAAVLMLLAGCSSPPVNGVRTFPGSDPVVPSDAISLTPNIAVELEKLVIWGAYAGVAWLILDPLAPNWEIEEAPLQGGYVHFSLKMKRVYSGGAGEALAIFHRRAKELMQYNGFDAYEVVEYGEGLESSVLGSRRTATGVIRLTRSPPMGGATLRSLLPSSPEAR